MPAQHAGRAALVAARAVAHRDGALSSCWELARRPGRQGRGSGGVTCSAHRPAGLAGGGLHRHDQRRGGGAAAAPRADDHHDQRRHAGLPWPLRVARGGSSRWESTSCAPSRRPPGHSYVAAVLIVGVGALGLGCGRRPPRPARARAFEHHPRSASPASPGPTGHRGPGALIAGEYAASGIIRRLPRCIAAKLYAVAVRQGDGFGLAACLALCLPATLAAFLVGQSILFTERLDATLGQPGRGPGGRWRRPCTWPPFACGARPSRPAARFRRGRRGPVRPAVRAPVLVGVLPSTWSDQIYGYLPAPAGIAITNMRPDPVSFAPWTGFGVFCLSTAVCSRSPPGGCVAATPEAANATGANRRTPGGVLPSRQRSLRSAPDADCLGVRSLPQMEKLFEQPETAASPTPRPRMKAFPPAVARTRTTTF